MRRIAIGSLVTILFAGLLLHAKALPSAGPSQLGKISFPTSCSAGVQPSLETGVALLHSFQYLEAEHTFTDAATRDPKCAMAHWGHAMALYHQLWDFPQDKTLAEGRKDIEQAQKIGAASERERGYIAAAAVFFQDNTKLSHVERRQAYSAALAKLREQNPQDVDASAFYALSLVSLAESEHLNETENLKKAIAILDALFHQQPDNPGPAHYLIHATDTPEFAPQGLEAARSYAKIAPDSSHALHMPSHIFTRLGLWQESIASNIASAASAAKATQEHRGEPHYQFHAMDFLDYTYLQTGEESKARHVVEDVKDVPGADDEDKNDHIAFYQAQNALELHRWKEAASLPIPKVRLSYQDTTYWVRAIGAARIGDSKAAREAAAKLQEIATKRDAHSQHMGYTSGTKGEKATDLMEAEAWAAFAEGKSEEAVKTLRAAADREDAKGVSSVAIPAREMLADLLLELKRPAEALAEYKVTLKESPNRFDSLYGASHAAQASGDSATAHQYSAKLLEICAPTADRAEVAETKSSLSASVR